MLDPEALVIADVSLTQNNTFQIIIEWFSVNLFVVFHLNPVSGPQVLKKLRRLPGGPGMEAALVRCLLRSVKGRFAHAALAASITAGLARYRPSLGIALVDALLEDIRLGLEQPESGAPGPRPAS